MKSLSHTRRGIAALAAAALLLGMPAALAAQQASQPPPPTNPPAQGTQAPQSIVSQPVGAAVSARAGQRTARPLPPPDTDGIHLSLDEAIRVALANNQDLNVSVNTAESAQFFLFQQTGIYDPLLTGNGLRSHTEFPTSSALSGGTVIKTDTSSGRAQVSQLTPWGSIFSLGFNADR